LFASENVEFLVVGAHALAFHGVPRLTGDLDLLVNPFVENARRVVSALAAFGFAGLGLTEQDFLVEGQVFQLGVSPNRIDLLTSISGVSFAEAWASKEPGALAGVDVFYLGRGALIKNKKAVGRLQDQADVAALEEAAGSQ
jgi:hypothetical protein